MAVKHGKKLVRVHVSHCVASTLLFTTSVNIWELRRAAVGPVGETFLSDGGFYLLSSPGFLCCILIFS